MFRLHSLRARVAPYFAGFGALLSLVMAVLLYQSAHDLGQRLIDETLTAELDDYIARRERNPLSAFSYTDAGSVTIHQDSRSLVISDTGRGIPGDAIDQAFLRHFRDITSTGAGIGLSLVKRICDRYGWQVRLESGERQGTTVTVVFAR